MSADFDLSLEITADAQQATKAGGDLSKALQGVEGLLKRVADATESLAQKNQNAGKQSESFKRKIKEMGDGVGRSKTNLANFSQQLDDISIGLQSGTKFSTIFAQQASQVAFALNGVGGKLGSVVGFLNGPWGAAAILATGLALKLGESFFESGEAAKKHAAEIEKTRKATEDLLEAQGKAIQTQHDKLVADLNAIAVERQTRREIVQTTIALLEQAKARLALAENGSNATDSSSAALEAEKATREVLSLDAKLAEARKSFNETTAPLGIIKGRIIADNVETRRDPTKANQLKYDTAVKAAIQKFGGNATALAKQIETLGIAFDKEKKRIADANKTTSKGSGLSGNFVTSAQAAAIGRAAGFQVNSVDRTYAQQKALYDNPLVNRPGNPVAKPGTSAHERGAALDIQYGSGVTPQSIRKAYADEGVAITKLIKEAGHYHIEFAKNTEANKAYNDSVREAAKAQADLKRDLEATLKALDPAAEQAAKYAKQLADIAKLQAAGPKNGGISADEAAQYRFNAGIENFDAQQKIFEKQTKELFGNLSAGWSDAILEPLSSADFQSQIDKLGKDISESIRKGLHEGLSDGALQAGENIASSLGNLFGGKAGSAFGGIGEILNQQRTNPSVNVDGGTFGRDVTKLLGKNGGIGLKKESADLIGKNVGKAFAGAEFGASLNKAIAPIGKALGIKTSKTGAQVGGAIGQLSGIPGGQIIGSVIGSVIGGLFKKTATGYAVVSGTKAGDVSSGGKLGAASAQDASTIQGGVNSIAQALGGELGQFLVSIGKRGDYFRVSGSGATNLGDKNTGKISGLLYDGKDEQEAIRVAILNAIADGGVKGISAAMQKALNSTTDLDQAVAEALKVRDIEDIIGGIGATLKRGFDAFEAQAKERVRVATEYGFDVVKIEERNNADRKALLEKVIADSVGPLQTLLKDLDSGNLFEGSLVDQRSALIGNIASSRNDVSNGVDGAAATLADLERRLLEVSKDAFGTAGPEYASDRATARADAERAVAEATKRAQDAQDQATGLLNAANSTVALGNEANNLAAQQLAALNALVAMGYNASGPGSGLGLGGGGAAGGTNRYINLNVANL